LQHNPYTDHREYVFGQLTMSKQQYVGTHNRLTEVCIYGKYLTF